MKKIKRVLRPLIAFSLAFCAVFLLTAQRWLAKNFEDVSIEQIFFFAGMPVKGSEPSLFLSFTEKVVIRSLLISLVFVFFPILISCVWAMRVKIKTAGLTLLKQAKKGVKFLYSIKITTISPQKKIENLLIALPAVFILIMLVLPFFNDFDIEPVKFYNPKPSENVLTDPRFLIGHAGGALHGKLLTNSKEALENSKKNGLKIIELDLSTTRDGHLIAAHDWEHFNDITHGEDYLPLSLAEALKKKIFGQYTPIDSHSIKDFFTANPEMILVTDKERDIGKIKNEFPFSERLIVEVFSINDYHLALAEGVLYPTLNVDPVLGSNMDFKKPRDIKKLLRHDVRMITTGTRFFNQNISVFKYLHNKGVTIMLYGPKEEINNAEFLKEHLGSTVSMAYVDFCSPSNKRCMRE